MSKTYAEYEHSGIEWLGDLPLHWGLPKLKWITTKIGSGSTPRGGSEVYQDDGVIFLRSQNIQFDGLDLEDVAYISEDIHADMERSAVEPGDVLLNITGASIGRCTCVPREFESANVNQHVCIVRPVDEVVPEYVHMVLASKVGQYQVFSLQDGSSREGLNYAQLGGFAIPLPPLEEQRTIAAYLDRKTAQIDTLIEKKQRLIDLLQEQRTVVINRAVTQGLDPDAPMQDSGIEWLGEVPAHWSVLALKRVVDKFIDYRGRTPTKTDEGVLLITAKNIEEGYINLEESQEFISPEDYDEWMTRGLPEKGDVLVTTEAPLGKVAQVEDERIALAQRIILLRVFKDKIRNDYLKYYLLSVAGQSELLSRATGSTARGIKASKLKEIAVSVPPLEEQDRIIRRLDTVWNEIDEVIQHEQDLVARLKELRTSLISEVVTGKIDVREEEAVLA